MVLGALAVFTVVAVAARAAPLKASPPDRAAIWAKTHCWLAPAVPVVGSATLVSRWAPKATGPVGAVSWSSRLSRTAVSKSVVVAASCVPVWVARDLTASLWAVLAASVVFAVPTPKLVILWPFMSFADRDLLADMKGSLHQSAAGSWQVHGNEKLVHVEMLHREFIVLRAVVQRQKLHRCRSVSPVVGDDRPKCLRRGGDGREGTA